MLRKFSRLMACLSLVCVGLVVQGSAQVHTASLTGLVTDPAGAGGWRHGDCEE